jgi:hypothetical protein
MLYIEQHIIIIIIIIIIITVMTTSYVSRKCHPLYNTCWQVYY